MAAAAALPAVPEIFSEMATGPGPGGAAAGLAWLDARGRSLGHFVAGAWLEPPGREMLEVREAATGRRLAVVPRGDRADVAAAVAAAEAAAAAWGRLGGPDRARGLRELAAGVARGAAALAALDSLPSGRPLAETLGADLPLGLRLLEQAAAWAQLGRPRAWAPLGETRPRHPRDPRDAPPQTPSWVPRAWAPLGVVGVIVSSPCSLLAALWKIGPALAMGNAVVLLAPAEAPLAPLLLAALWAEAPLPPGLLNVLAAPPELRRALAAHPGPRALAFVGPPQEGRALRRATAGRDVRLSLALGGRPLAIVLDSADLDAAAGAVAAAAGAPPGPVPAGGGLVLAQEGVAAALARRLRARLGGLRVGDPLDGGSDVGPLPPHTASPEPLVQEARAEGAQVFQSSAPLPPGGRFYPPTLITGVAPTSRCVRQGPGGPVVVLVAVRSPAEAAAVANALPRAWAAGVWAEDAALAADLAARLRVGLVWLNGQNLLDPASGAGGTTGSGTGDDGGLEALREFGRPPWEPPPPPGPPRPPSRRAAAPPRGRTPPRPTAPARSNPRSRWRQLGLMTSLMMSLPLMRSLMTSLPPWKPPGRLLSGGPLWGRRPGPARARVLRAAAEALRDGDGDDGATERLRAALLRWAAHAQMERGALQAVPGGRVLVTRAALGVVGVAWAGPRPCPALELLPPALALGNALVLLAPPGGAAAARRLAQ
ncbi:LOW QUALITY PROTEIN: aldehyde dehydrogenase family 16 member A1, partial [Struthio camelus]|uniref:LOW QUALITY PROTEIN: aldehyde dehydrogenase family 16 member A1 n=1 Tax=Struthio camelus TaxID=8801 RepID=UPI003603EDB4